MPVDRALAGHPGPHLDLHLGHLEAMPDERHEDFDLGIIVVACDYPPLQRKGTNNPALSIIKFGDRTWTVLFKFLNLGQIRRVNKKQARGRAYCGREYDKESKQDDPKECPSANLYRRRMSIDDFQSQFQYLELQHLQC